MKNQPKYSPCGQPVRLSNSTLLLMAGLLSSVLFGCTTTSTYFPRPKKINAILLKSDPITNGSLVSALQKTGCKVALGKIPPKIDEGMADVGMIIRQKGLLDTTDTCPLNAKTRSCWKFIAELKNAGIFGDKVNYSVILGPSVLRLLNKWSWKLYLLGSGIEGHALFALLTLGAIVDAEENLVACLVQGIEETIGKEKAIQMFNDKFKWTEGESLLAKEINAKDVLLERFPYKRTGKGECAFVRGTKEKVCI